MNIDYILHCRSAPYQSSRGWRKLDENWIWVHILKHFEKKKGEDCCHPDPANHESFVWFHNDIIDQYEIWPFQRAAVVNLLLLSGACLCIQRCSSTCLNAPLWDAGRGRRSKQAAQWERLVCAHSQAHGLASQVHSLAHTLKEALFSAVCKMFFLGQASTGL